jgi:hypothetical protein
VTDTDDVTVGELSRQLSDWRAMTQGNFAALDTRMQGLASATVPGAVYQADRALYDQKLIAAQKLSDERYEKLRADIAAIAQTQHEILQDAKDRSKRIANNRTVVGMALFTSFLLPMMVLIFQHWTSL